MGSSAEKAWAAILRDVQYMGQHGRTARASDADAVAVVAAIRAHLALLNQQPPFPRATWKKLVVDLKVGWCAADQQNNQHMKDCPN